MPANLPSRGRIGSSKDGGAGLEHGGDACFGNGDSLLFHGLPSIPHAPDSLLTHSFILHASCYPSSSPSHHLPRTHSLWSLSTTSPHKACPMIPLTYPFLSPNLTPHSTPYPTPTLAVPLYNTGRGTHPWSKRDEGLWNPSIRRPCIPRDHSLITARLVVRKTRFLRSRFPSPHVPRVCVRFFSLQEEAIVTLPHTLPYVGMG